MTPIERAARVLHKRYIEERIRNGVKPADLPAWGDLGEDGRYYFTAPVRDVIAAIREPSESMADAAGNRETIGYDAAPSVIWETMIDALLEEGR